MNELKRIDFKFRPESKSDPFETGASRGWIVCFPQTDEGDMQLSPDCATAKEIEDCADELRKDLDRVVKIARTRLPKD
jgi:hypothetical protein